jgi:hypothetical protein
MLITPIIAIEGDNVSVIFDDAAQTRLDHPGIGEIIISRAEFVENCLDGYPLLTGVKQANFEPSRQIYHIVRDDGTIEIYDKAKDHPLMQALQQDVGKIIAYVKGRTT